MKLEFAKIVDQIYVLPYIKVTYSRELNGNYEFIVGWMNYQISILM